MDTFELCVRECSWANPPIARLTMEDREYENLETGAKFYLTASRDRLILTEHIKWDDDGKPWISR